jgi:hypothetical protein
MSLYWDFTGDVIVRKFFKSVEIFSFNVCFFSFQFPVVADNQSLLFNNFKRSKSYGLYQPDRQFSKIDLSEFDICKSLSHVFSLLCFLFCLVVGGAFGSFENFCINYKISPQYLPLSATRMISQNTK